MHANFFVNMLRLQGVKVNMLNSVRFCVCLSLAKQNICSGIFGAHIRSLGVISYLFKVKARL